MTKAHNWILNFSYFSTLAPKIYTAFGLSCAPCIPTLSQSQWNKRAVPVDFHRSPPDKSEIIKLHTTEILIISYRHALRLIRNSTPNFRLLPFWFGWTRDGMQHGVVEKRSSFVDATKTTTAKKKIGILCNPRISFHSHLSRWDQLRWLQPHGICLARLPISSAVFPSLETNLLPCLLEPSNQHERRRAQYWSKIASSYFITVKIYVWNVLWIISVINYI